jgi:hypothetical protein
MDGVCFDAAAFYSGKLLKVRHKRLGLRSAQAIARHRRIKHPPGGRDAGLQHPEKALRRVWRAPPRGSGETIPTDGRDDRRALAPARTVAAVTWTGLNNPQVKARMEAAIAAVGRVACSASSPSP